MGGWFGADTVGMSRACDGKDSTCLLNGYSVVGYDTTNCDSGMQVRCQKCTPASEEEAPETPTTTEVPEMPEAYKVPEHD